MKLIINADDFGYSEGVNYGIVRAYSHGVVTSTTLMANGLEVDHAIELARQNPGLDVGIHVVLDYLAPVTAVSEVPSLVNLKGQFKKLHEVDEKSIQLHEVALEIENQIQLLLKRGVTLTHMDSHHHVHLQPHIFEICVKLAHKYGLWLRITPEVSQWHREFARSHNVKTIVCNALFYKDLVSDDFFNPYVAHHEIEELMTHPAYCDAVLQQGSSYALERVTELSVLTQMSLISQLKDQGIILTSYSKLNEV